MAREVSRTRFRRYRQSPVSDDLSDWSFTWMKSLAHETLRPTVACGIELPSNPEYLHCVLDTRHSSEQNRIRKPLMHHCVVHASKHCRDHCQCEVSVFDLVIDAVSDTSVTGSVIPTRTSGEAGKSQRSDKICAGEVPLKSFSRHQSILRSCEAKCGLLRSSSSRGRPAAFQMSLRIIHS